MATEQPTLKCGACGHENELERVYCHSCGQKLDRSVLPKQEPKKAEDDEAKKHKHVKKMMNAGRGSIIRELKLGVFVLVMSALIAAVFLACQAPDGVPPEKSDSLPDRDAGELWERMVAAPTAVAVTFTELEINAYLKRVIKPAEGFIPRVSFKRAYVKFEPEVVTINIERDVWGMKAYSSVAYRTSKDGKYDPEVAGVYFGRLRVHPLAKMLGEFSISGVTKAFEKEKDGLARLADVKVGQGSITIVTKAR